MRLTILPLLAFLIASPALAQDRGETLADIRQELSILFAEVQAMTRELSTTSGAIGGVQLPPSAIDRVNVIESELQRVTAKTEELQFKIDRLVKDGTNRIGDLEFRLCELEDGCDIASLGDTPTLGGGVLPDGPAASLPSEGGSAELAMGEQADFDQAKKALETGDGAEAARLLAVFVQAYPAGPLTVAAHQMRGDALSQAGDPGEAARAYLNAFSADPQGSDAPQSLLRLGQSLGALGQIDDACIMLGEIAVRFPGDPAVAQADAARTALGCV